MAHPFPNTSTQRQLARQYKARKPPMGVYVIRNVVDRHVYVGASLDVDGAMNRHRFELKLHGHRNRSLAREWKQHGADNFVFEVIDRLKPRDEPGHDCRRELADLLAMWIEELACPVQRCL